MLLLRDLQHWQQLSGFDKNATVSGLTFCGRVTTNSVPTHPDPLVRRLETFDLNGFEQLCKNYAVEKTRWKFLEDEACSGASEGGTGGTARGRNAREVADQVAKSRQLLAMFEGEGRAWERERYRARRNVVED